MGHIAAERRGEKKKPKAWVEDDSDKEYDFDVEEKRIIDRVIRLDDADFSNNFSVDFSKDSSHQSAELPFGPPKEKRRKIDDHMMLIDKNDERSAITMYSYYDINKVYNVVGEETSTYRCATELATNR